MIKKRGTRVASSSPLFIEKLASSGLDLDDAAALGMEYLAGPQAAALGPKIKALASLWLPYFGLDGQPLSFRPKHPPFWRLRYLEQDTSFAAVAEAKPSRYAQPMNSGVCAYLPKTLNWQAIAADPMAWLCITEGELKAAKACKEGFSTIGLGGVWNFKSTRESVPFLNELEAINWVKRNVYIVYDSDFRDKEGIVAAINELASELVDRGALVYAASLPDLFEDEERKTGLDDFLIHTSGGVAQLTRLLHEAQPLLLARPLHGLNEKVCYVKNPGLLVELATDNKLSPSAFKEHAYATARYIERKMGPDEEVSLKKVSAADAWLKWQHRREVNKLTYRPGRDKFCDDDGPAYNTWTGWGVEPKKGDTRPWHQLLKHLFHGSEPGALEWFLDWCAWPLQHPGTKLFSAVVVHGIHEGTGKSLVGYTLGRIYGDNFSEIEQDDLHSGQNDWAENKQFILGDEVTGSDRLQDRNTLKKLITQKKIRIDIKYVPRYELPDCINYYFTSNEPGAFFIGDKDRRYLVIEVVLPPMDEEIYNEYDLWLNGHGPAALFYELLQRDLSGFNPAGHAFSTKAKQRMVADTRSDLASWVRQLLETPAQILKIGQLALNHDIMTNKELLRLYDVDGSRKVTANGLGRELRRAGVPLANGGAPITTCNGTDRYYIIRHLEQWLNATPKQLAAHVEQAEAGLVKRGLRR